MSYAENVGFVTGVLPPDKAIAIAFHPILWICPRSRAPGEGLRQSLHFPYAEALSSISNQNAARA